mgnify:CR=1 FL=1
MMGPGQVAALLEDVYSRYRLAVEVGDLGLALRLRHRGEQLLWELGRALGPGEEIERIRAACPWEGIAEERLAALADGQKAVERTAAVARRVADIGKSALESTRPGIALTRSGTALARHGAPRDSAAVRRSETRGADPGLACNQSSRPAQNGATGETGVVRDSVDVGPPAQERPAYGSQARAAREVRVSMDDRALVEVGYAPDRETARARQAPEAVWTDTEHARRELQTAGLEASGGGNRCVGEAREGTGPAARSRVLPEIEPSQNSRVPGSSAAGRAGFRVRGSSNARPSAGRDDANGVGDSLHQEGPGQGWDARGAMAAAIVPRLTLAELIRRL